MKTSTVVNIGSMIYIQLYFSKLNQNLINKCFLIDRIVDRTAIENKIEAETKTREAALALQRHKPVIEVKKKLSCIIN